MTRARKALRLFLFVSLLLMIPSSFLLGWIMWRRGQGDDARVGVLLIALAVMDVLLLVNLIHTPRNGGTKC